MKAKLLDGQNEMRRRSGVVRDVLEPDVLRGTRPVLRGLRGSNASWLPDWASSAHEMKQKKSSNSYESSCKRNSS